ncbi:uncharacterized protein LOC111911342 [Lactuca sativa]|uniref:uncharacterized protein LOC111911342 n=1 Tax=Lactuca sativa TaxID=4236 RepID=UPI001C68E338|nr:uncharacterized protein LOC111911342 [Lactuca sativa]
MLEAVGQFGRGAPPQTRYEMGETYLKKEVERTINLLTPYKDEWKSNGCLIMTDAWSDRKKRNIMNLCVNSKTRTVFLSSKESSDEAHTSEHMHEYVESCIKEVSPENVVQIVTDSNNMGVTKLLKEKRPTIFWTSCATHTLNLMLESIGGLPRYKKILDHAKTLMVFIYAHHKTLAMTRHVTKKRDIVRPGVTLSNTFKGKAAYNIVINATFWTDVALCLKVFAPLVKVLRMVDVDRKLSMGFVYGELQNAKQEIINALGNNKKNNPEIQNDIDVTDEIVDFVDTIHPGDHSLQNHIVIVELPVYMGKQEKIIEKLQLKDVRYIQRKEID